MVQCRVERLLKGDAFCYKAVLNEAAAGDRVAQHGVYFVEGQSVLHTGAKGFFVVVIKVDAAALEVENPLLGAYVGKGAPAGVRQIKERPPALSLPASAAARSGCPPSKNECFLWRKSPFDGIFCSSGSG